MTAGYSRRSLAAKLGIQPGTQVTALGAPPTYASLLGTLPEGAALHSRLPASSSFIHRFARLRRDLAADFPRIARALTDEGSLWISWPKQASGVETDVWSALKFVRRIGNRSSRKSKG